MNTGELNKRITFIIENEDSQDEEGFPVKGEKQEKKIWAKVFDTTGTKLLKSNSDFSKKVTHFIIRYQKNFKPDESMKIKFNNKDYNIIYVNEEDYSHRFIEVIGEVITNV
jgi:SPP1 family predicted phage head-tail adaptor